MSRIKLAAFSAIAAVAFGAGVSAIAAPDTSQPSSSALHAKKISYVALGDSYTSAPYVPVMDPANGCARSSNNYPHQIAKALNTKSFTDVSCSGAETRHVFKGQYAAVGRQLNAVKPDTKLVTISLGGNDENLFGSLVEQCVKLGVASSQDPTLGKTPCTDYFNSAARKKAGTTPAQILARTQQRVLKVVWAVRAKAPRAKVMVVGYPMIAPKTAPCQAFPVAPGDLAFVRQANAMMSDALRKATVRGRAQFVDLIPASAGHELCSADPWINGPQTDEQRALSFHPFRNEQDAVAKLVLAKLPRSYKK